METLKDGASNKTTFTIDDDGSGQVWLLGWTKAENPKVSVSVEAPPAPTTSREATSWVPSATGTATSRPTGGAERVAMGRWSSFFAASAIVFIHVIH